MTRMRWSLTTALTLLVAASMVASVAVATPAEAATKRAEVRKITTGGHPGFDRIVFEVGNAHPNVNVVPITNVSAVTIKDVSGKRVELKGTTLTAITLKPAVIKPPSSGKTYTGPNAIQTKLPTLRQAIITGNSKDQVTVVLDLSAQTGYRTFTLDSPRRVVVDVATPVTPTKNTQLRSRKEPADYQIVGLKDGVKLRVRDHPEGNTVAKLSADTVNIRTTGNRARRDGEKWVQIWMKDRTGWVKAKHLELMPT